MCACVCTKVSQWYSLGKLDFRLHHQKGKEERERERRLQQQPKGSHIPAYVNKFYSVTAIIEVELYKPQQAKSQSH